jgi:hypothetical protein
MLTVKSIKDWLKTFNTKFDKYYCGKLDNKYEKSLGVYQLDQNNIPHIALGGLQSTGYKIKPISLLIHWTKDSDDTELQAIKLYKELELKFNFDIGDIHVYYVEILVNEPIDVHTDDEGVFERVIQLVFYYERSR